MTTASDAKLRQMFDTLLGAYNFTPRKGEWEAWQTWVAPLPEWAVGNTVMEAPDRWPNKFPTAGQIREVVMGMVSRRDEQSGEQTEGMRPSVPTVDQIHPAFAKLAQQWEDESKKAGWDPDKPCPRAVGSRRMRELVKLWDEHATISGGGIRIDPRYAPRDRRTA